MFHLTIVTPEKSIYEGDVMMLVAPAVDGEIGIMTNHHPLVTKLGIGGLKIKKTDDTEEILFLNGGYLEVNNNKVAVLANVLEYVEEIEKEQARQAREKAQEMIKKAPDDLEFEKLEKEVQMHLTPPFAAAGWHFGCWQLCWW